MSTITPTPLSWATRTMVSIGTIPSRVGRVKTAAVRGVIVELTDGGKELWDTTVAAQAEKESLVDSVLGEREKRQLNDLLRRLMHAFEDVHGPVHPPHD